MLTSALLLAFLHDADRTTVQVEILMPPDGRGGLAAQTWGRWFDDAGYRLTTRRARPGETSGVEETNRGRLRTVTVSFLMDRQGGLSASGQSYPAGGSKRLEDWLAELKQYGAAGRPNNQPQWGLSKSALTAIENAAAADAIPATTIGDLAGQMANRFGAAVELGPAVSDRTKLPAVPDVACGTAAAWQLQAVGCGWEPRRQPDGSVRIVIDRLSDEGNEWPVGWDVPRRIRSDRPIPRLFAEASFPSQPLPARAFADELSQTTETPILELGQLRSASKLSAGKIGLQTRTSRPYPVLKKELAKFGYSTRIRLDDAGVGMVVFKPYRPGDFTPATVSPLVPARVKQRLQSMAD